jgi:hemerythrin superfamily protein
MAPRSKQRGQSRDAIAMLKADHHKMHRLFVEYQAAMDRATQRSVANLVFVELETHAQLEEHVFYPAVKEKTEEGPGLVKGSLEEHQTMKQLIQELRDMGPDTKAFEAKFRELRRNVEHHVAAEEAALFPLAEEELGKAMQDLRDEMQELKATVLGT